jgi:hypothetical protein
MMLGQITGKQGHALARFVHELRPDWDVPGIEDALWQARSYAPVVDLASAAMRAALEPSNRTPRVIALDGAHWRGSEAQPKLPEPNDGDRCSTCSEPKARCRARWRDDHPFRSVRDNKAAARETARQKARAVTEEEAG